MTIRKLFVSLVMLNLSLIMLAMCDRVPMKITHSGNIDYVDSLNLYLSEYTTTFVPEITQKKSGMVYVTYKMDNNGGTKKLYVSLCSRNALEFHDWQYFLIDLLGYYNQIPDFREGLIFQYGEGTIYEKALVDVAAGWLEGQYTEVQGIIGASWRWDFMPPCKVF